MNGIPRILIVDDDEALCEMLTDVLLEKPYHIDSVYSGESALNRLKEDDYHLLILDLLLPGMNGLEVLRKAAVVSPQTMVILISGHGSIENAVEATRLGAYDWLEKPLKKDRVLLTVQNALDKIKLMQEKAFLLSEIKDRYRMVGSSEVMKRVYRLIDRMAGAQTMVLITGESGTGKELVARAIHMNHPRAGQPFVEVNCAAVPDTLIESELFGHVKGAFTGAMNNRKGKFQSADGGTLFLDEIGDLSLMAQAKILRVLENQEVTPLGSERTENVDVRVISATNKDLGELVGQNRFREDLYHRINVVTIDVPPLRERRDDIIPLLNHYLSLFAETNHMEVKCLTPAAEAVLMRYDWPGNVRELRNFTEKLMVLSDTNQITHPQVSRMLHVPEANSVHEEPHLLREAKNDFEKHYILSALNDHLWNVSKTARSLGIVRSLLYRKMEQFGLNDMAQK
ncbi:MAG TPA: sigma-54-dependent Fis family transcriptional regulator [bacterium]|nr:sigma-54-dependent Fis family transcriptional regulator [bacterium]